MLLSQKILETRRKKGLTQEDLADRANLTVRTIQRIESGDTVPRPFTVKAIAAALEIRFEELTEVKADAKTEAATEAETKTKAEALPTKSASHDSEEARNFLQLLCLSCFSYIIIPFVHFLIPQYLLNKRQEKNPEVLAFGRLIIRWQIIWLIVMNLLFMLTLAYNLYCKAHFTDWYKISYLVPFFLMYAVNAIIILGFLRKTRQRISGRSSLLSA